MPDTLKRIFGPANVPSGTSTVFTGVAGRIYTIKTIKIINPTSTAITIKLGIQATAGTLNDNELILPNSQIDAGGMAVFQGTIILSGTEVIRAVTSASGLTISGHGLEQT